MEKETMPGTSAAPEGSLKVAYILKMFPRLSETFILNEILQLEENGVDVSVFSLLHPMDGRYHGRLARLKLTVEHFIRDKVDAHWNNLNDFDRQFVPRMERWEEAADFLRRHSIPKDFELLLRSVNIAARVNELGIQHIHAHFATISTRVAALVNILTGVPFSFTSHAKDIFRETVDRALYAELVDRAAFNITVSDYNREYILTRTPGVDGSKVIRLYNGIDLEFFNSNEKRSAEEIPRIVSIGRLVPKKGFDVLFASLAQWKAKKRPFEAVVIGTGEDTENLHRLRRDLDLEAEVELAGALPQEQVRTLLSKATMTVLPCVPDAIGNQDALPTTLLEALALGIPIVSTRLAGVPEIVGESCGEIAEPKDVDGLTAAMDRMLDRVKTGEYSPDEARERARQLFDLSTNASTLHGYFLESARGAR